MGTSRWTVATVLISAVPPVVAAAAVTLLTSLVSPSWTRTWWWAVAAILLVAVGVPAYLAAHHKLRRSARVRRVALASDGDGTMALFAVTNDGRVLRRTYHENGSWSDWSDHGFTKARAWDVAATTAGYGRPECFVADQSGGVWHRSRDREGWSQWGRLTGPQKVGSTVALSAISGWPGHREIYTVSESGRLHHYWKWDGAAWEGSADSARSDCRDVALSAPVKDQMECFALDRHGELWHRWYMDEHWSSWASMSRPDNQFAGIAAAALNGSERHQEIFVVSTSGELAHRWHWQGEDCSPWHRMPSPAHLTDVAAGITSVGRYEVVAVDVDGLLWQRSYPAGDAGWSMWRRI